MLLQEDQTAPFDIRDIGIIAYKESIGLEQHLKESIKKYLEKLNENSSDSPVIAVLKDRTYPEVEKKLEEIPGDKRTAGKNQIRRGRILWVDDYPSNNKTIINLFEDKNVIFDIAMTTRKGLELYKSNLYDVIITDMGRENESDAGLSLLKELKILQCQIPVIVYASRRAIERYGEEALRWGAYAITSESGNVVSAISAILKF